MNTSPISHVNFSTLIPSREVPGDKSHSPVTRSQNTQQSCSDILEKLTRYPDQAAGMVAEYAQGSMSLPVLDCKDYPPTMRLAATGEIWTDELRVQYHSMWMDSQPGRMRLYEAELAKGTSAMEIMEKLWDYNDALPPRFRKLAGW